MKGQWPLVGREAQLRHFERILRANDGNPIVLAGPAGVGKTRLAREFLERCRRANFATSTVVATRAASTLPFGAFAPLLPADNDESGDRLRHLDLLRHFAAKVVDRAEGRPLALFVDDAHLLDNASATLVHQLASTRSALVMATIRSDALAPDAVRSLWKDDFTNRIDLECLSPTAIARLLEDSLGGPIDPAAAAHLTARAQGNVLFLRELVLGALEAGTLRAEDGFWCLSGQVCPSDRLLELVNDRLSKLGHAERTLLEAIALGEPLRPEVIDLLGGSDLTDGLEREGLIECRSDGRLEVRMAHPVYADVVRAQIPRLRARAIYRSLADATETAGVALREDLLRVATWRLDGGDGARPELLLDAAVSARYRFDFALAERLARAAVGLGAKFDAALLAAQLASVQGRAVEAERELAELWDQAMDDAQRGVVAVSRIENLTSYLGRFEDALRVAEEAEAHIQDQGTRDEIAAVRVILLLAIAGPVAAVEAAAPLRRRASGRARFWACAMASVALGRMGRLDDADVAAAECESADLTATTPAAHEYWLQWYPWFHDFARSETAAHRGALSEAEELALDRYHQGLGDQSPEAQAWFSWQLSMRAIQRGHVETAIARGRESQVLQRQLGSQTFEQAAATHLALGLALKGQAKEAGAVLDAAEQLGTAPWYPVDLLEARAWSVVAAGNVPRAREHLRQAIALGNSRGDLVGEASALHTLARIGYAEEALPRLDELCSAIDGELIGARARHARAIAERDPEGLEAVSVVFERLGADLVSAEAAAMAAVFRRQQGAARAAVGDERRANMLVKRCEGAVSPALRSVGTLATLSPSEIRVALLAAEGRSNPDIAKELSLSVRTVANHLQHSYDKLGISRRSDLAEALARTRG